jgi:hypothetical protein
VGRPTEPFFFCFGDLCAVEVRRSGAGHLRHADHAAGCGLGRLEVAWEHLGGERRRGLVKLALAISALLCLLAAVLFSLLPARLSDGAPEHAAVAGPLGVAADEPELAGALGGELMKVEEPEPVDEVEPDGAGDPDAVILTGRVTPAVGEQPAVHLVLIAGCPGAPGDRCAREPVETDADPVTGEFVATLYAGTWNIVARANGYLPAVETGLTVIAGEELAELPMTLERGEHVRGRVVVDGEPISDVEVVTIGQGYTRHGITDERGRFQIDGLPKGTFTVRAYTEEVGGDEATVTSGGTVELSLGHRQKVRGRVIDSRGFPVEGALVFSEYTTVRVDDADPFSGTSFDLAPMSSQGCEPEPSCYRRAVTDAAGRFEVAGAPGEVVTLGAQLGDRFAVLGVVDPQAQPQVELALHAVTRVQLLDADNQPYEGILGISPAPSFFRDLPRSSSDGWLSIPHGTEEIYLPEGFHLAGELPAKMQVVEKETTAVY